MFTSVLTINLLTVLFHAAEPQVGAPQPLSCYEPSVIPDPLDPRCLKAPVSMPCLTSNQVARNQPGYRNTDDPPSQCGFRIRFWIFACPCGRAQANESCDG